MAVLAEHRKLAIVRRKFSLPSFFSSLPRKAGSRTIRRFLSTIFRRFGSKCHAAPPAMRPRRNSVFMPTSFNSPSISRNPFIPA